MSEYSELIKRFDKIRDYMRDFYVYGFKTREDFDRKSLRSYDNEKRRIESYLSDFMSFRQDENGKNIFLSVDSSDISTNPLYRAFKSKTFTKNDITLNFIILDILNKDEALSVTEIVDKIAKDYLVDFEEPTIPDVSTVRNKLSEYAELGILTKEKLGKKLLFMRSTSNINSETLSDALAFFSEVCPLGVVGSFLLDKCNYNYGDISFKHHYIMHALESEIVYELLEAIHKKHKVEIVNHRPSLHGEVLLEVVPLKMLISVQGGRRYLSAYSFKSKAILNFRLDYIKAVKILGPGENFDEQAEKLERILKHAWGASFGKGKKLEHLRMTLSIAHNEKFIVDRIAREGRHGVLTSIDDITYRYDIDVFDSTEMIPWLRTFTGRIISLECDNKTLVDTFYKDLDALYALYDGGEGDVV